MHQQIIIRCPAVDPQFGKLNPRVAFHGTEHVGHLQRNALKRCPGNMGARRASRHADQRTACRAIPERCPKPGEGGHQIGVCDVRDAGRQGFDLRRAADDAQAVAQPLDCCARHED